MSHPDIATWPTVARRRFSRCCSIREELRLANPQQAQTLSRFLVVVGAEGCAALQVDRHTTVLCHRLKTCTMLDLRIWYRSAPISGMTLGSRP